MDLQAAITKLREVEPAFTADMTDLEVALQTLASLVDSEERARKRGDAKSIAQYNVMINSRAQQIEETFGFTKEESFGWLFA